MASPDVLDFDRILTPVAEDAPAGPNLREDFSATSIYRMIKDARARVRKAERSAVMEDGDQSETLAEWRQILDQGVDLLTNKSKDYEVVAWLVEALVREHGFAGLRDGLRLARELAERYWDSLHPGPDDEDGMVPRVAALRGLNGDESEGTLIAPIRTISITTEGANGAFSYSDYLQAQDVERVEDPERRAQRIDQGARTLQQFEDAIAASDPQFLTDLIEDIEQSLDELDQLDNLLNDNCGEDASGEAVAPSMHFIRDVLRECRDTVRGYFAGDTAATADDPLATGSASGSTDGGGGAGGNVMAEPNQAMSREQAFAQLLRLADYFKRTEPHSPVSYALEQVVRWGRMPLPQLWSELISDEDKRSEVFRYVGIRTADRDSDSDDN